MAKSISIRTVIKKITSRIGKKKNTIRKKIRTIDNRVQRRE